MMALHDLARLGSPAEVVDRIEELAADLDGPLALARADHVCALVTDDSADLDAASRAFEALGSVLLAAEAAADAATAQRRAGGIRSATAFDRRATLLAARCEGAVTPALVADAPVLLSPREREIAGLAVAGLASREIAERLFVSVRTVENQLQRAYEKLGVSNRTELRSVFGASTSGLDPRLDPT
jgi:DNA-binding NarL/FixJ family response regulator